MIRVAKLCFKVILDIIPEYDHSGVVFKVTISVTVVLVNVHLRKRV